MIELVGNQEAIGLTERMIAKGKEPHSVMICGEGGLGKKTLAQYLAAQLLCDEGKGKPCGKCRNCRLVEKNQHPDFITVQSTETGNYKVEEIRKIVSDAYVSPNEARYKIYLIPDVDRSVQTSLQLQNILLKTIEEPPASTIVILTARSKEIFLDTIISRTIHLYAQEVSHADAQAYLIEHGVEMRLAEEAVRRVGGNIGRALHYADSEEERSVADLAVRTCSAIAAHNEYELLLAMSQCEGKKNTFITLTEYMQRVVRDAARMRVKAAVKFAYSQEVCSALSSAFTARRLADMYDVLGEYSRRAAANCLVSNLQNGITAELISI